MNFGLQVVLTAHPGKGAELAEAMLRASQLLARVEDCLIYIVQVAEADEHKILITEVWRSRQAHRDSLSIPAVRELIGKARPLIQAMEHHPARTLGGKGL